MRKTKQFFVAMCAVGILLVTGCITQRQTVNVDPEAVSGFAMSCSTAPSGEMAPQGLLTGRSVVLIGCQVAAKPVDVAGANANASVDAAAQIKDLAASNDGNAEVGNTGDAKNGVAVPEKTPEKKEDKPEGTAVEADPPKRD